MWRKAALFEWPAPLEEGIILTKLKTIIII